MGKVHIERTINGGVSLQASSRAKYKRDGIAGNTQNFKKNSTYTAIEP